ncbi:CocE/NonD family hydrolase [Marinobacter salarius]|uniref:CocE/NonD family hydrolase n=1 Tax=Marinobacter salarius TaxID=1420917 RepID=UPI003D9C3067
MKFVLITSSLILIAILAVLGYRADDVKLWLGDVTMPMRENMQRARNVMVPMRDGVKLATDVYRPLGNKRHPVVYIRTTYGGIEFSTVRHFVRHNYAVIVQHVRGRFYSEGRYKSPYWTAKQDGYDTIEWLVEQPWSTGKIGTFGCSYLGESQIILAAANHPNHIAMIASGAGGAAGKVKDTFGYFGVFENGVLNLASSLGWFTAEGAKDFKVTPRPDDYEERMRTYMTHLPVSGIADRIVPYETGFDDIIRHPLTDKWWDEEGYTHPDDEFSVATLHINDWFDQTAHNTFKLAEHMAENARHPRAKSQPVLIAPGVHCGAGKLKPGEVTIGEMSFDYAGKDFRQTYIDWFDHWLKDKPTALPPPFEYYSIHSGEWDTSEQWPPASTSDQRFYFMPDDRLVEEADLNNNPEQSGEVYDEFTYDPLDPVPTLGGPICCTYRPEDKPGPLDQRPLKSRQDVLVYSSEPLEEDLELVGNANVVLYVSTNAPDTDFTVKMVDQYPDGRAFNLQDDVVRLRYRNGIDNPSPVEPGRIYRVELEMRPIAYRFRKGHRLEFHISSSNFPRLARNLNTGKDEYSDSDTFVATNRVYFGGDTPSSVALPIKTSE